MNDVFNLLHSPPNTFLTKKSQSNSFSMLILARLKNPIKDEN
jgi:hypothetical protein